METTVKTNATLLAAQKHAGTQENKLWATLEANRFGIIANLLLIIGCLGGISASYGADYDTLQLSLIVFPTILSLALILAVAPMKSIVSLSGIAVILDLLVLIF